MSVLAPCLFFASLSKCGSASAAIAAYARDVRERRFPAAEHVFGNAPTAAKGGEAA